jgi:hypothetical protein
VFGQTLLVPGDMAAFDASADLPTTPEVKHMLGVLRTAAAKPPVPTSRHGKANPPAPYFPEAAKTATHVFVRRNKAAKEQLRPVADGPFPIVRRLGDTRLQLLVGHFADGRPRHEEVHWSRCSIAHRKPDQPDAVRVPLGRRPKKQLNPQATSFIPAKPSPQSNLGPAMAPGSPSYAQVVSSGPQAHSPPSQAPASSKPTRTRRQPDRLTY